jgi:hypothetical protein
VPDEVHASVNPMKFAVPRSPLDHVARKTGIDEIGSLRRALPAAGDLRRDISSRPSRRVYVTSVAIRVAPVMFARATRAIVTRVRRTVSRVTKTRIKPPRHCAAPLSH